jgi:hypothetical protein
MSEEQRCLGSFVSAARAATSDAVMILPIATPQSTFHATGHPLELRDTTRPKDGVGYVDQVVFSLSDRKTPHNGPIPRFI